MDMTITLCFSLVLLGNSVAHDASATSTIPSNKVPPLLFPEDASQYRIIKENETAIQHILQITSKDDVIREIPLTEGQPTTLEIINTTAKVEELVPSTVEPLKHSQEKDEPSHEESDEDKDEDDGNYYDETTDDPKEEFERIQSDGKYKTTDELEEQFNRNDEENKKSPEIVDIVVDYPDQMDHTHIVAIIAVVTMAILAFAIYFGLIFWRYHLQKIYGSRQRLVTEDDWYHNDSRDFEI